MHMGLNGQVYYKYVTQFSFSESAHLFIYNAPLQHILFGKL